MIDESHAITYVDEGLSLQRGHKSIEKCVYRGTQDFGIYDKKVGKKRCCSAVPLGFIVFETGSLPGYAQKVTFFIVYGTFLPCLSAYRVMKKAVLKAVNGQLKSSRRQSWWQKPV